MKRLRQGTREDSSEVGLGHIQPHLLITLPADEPDFDNMGGAMPLSRSSDAPAFQKSSALSTVKSNPTLVL